jgi:S-adenosylmethionine:tRNA ribosyltransferase-isomerase
VETAAFEYDLPAERIAQEPLSERDAAKLLVDRGAGSEPDDRHVRELPDLLDEGDLLVVNETRVRRARLALRKDTGGAAEVLLLERREDGAWLALVRPSRKLPPGTVLSGEGRVRVEVGDDQGGGQRLVRFLDASGRDQEERLIAGAGQMPLPPYITTPLADADRYQTVFAETTGSSAAPTAGLHLTRDLLDRCRAQGVDVATVDLEIGLDTFRPIAVDDIDDHTMHTETYRVPEDTLAACERASRVVAVGTTVVRALESAASTGKLDARTDLFIKAGHQFALVDLLLTNFHLPRSTLLVMIDAFVGPRWRELYQHALDHDYRFLSFGDALLLRRSP